MAEPETAAADPRRRWDLLPRLEKGQAAKVDATGTVSIRRNHPATTLLFGPYWQLAQGRYRLSFTVQARRARFSGQPVLAVEVIVLNQLQQLWRDFTAAELEDGAVVFDVPFEFSLESGQEARTEFRFVHLGAADLSIESITLERVEASVAATEPTHRWRLLGRMEAARTGRRGRDGSVAVGARAAAGPLLFGGWPYLRLPRGRFRLTVEGQVEALAGVEVEVLAPSRWRHEEDALAPVLTARGSISATTPLTGAASLEFVIPPELTIDARADAPVEVRLAHAGGGAVRVEAVTLERIEGESAEPSPLNAPAVGGRARAKVVIIGNCQSDILRQGFTWVEALNRRFEAKYHFVALPDAVKPFARLDLEQADVLLVQDISDWERFALRDDVPARLEPIRFPGVRFASLWPFDGWNGPGDPVARAQEGTNLAFPYLDGLLARLRREIPDPEARFRAYRDLDVKGLIAPERMHSLEERRLLATDAKFDCDIGAFTLERFRSQRLFHTTVRPNREVLDRLMRLVLKAMGVKGEHPLPESIESVLREPQAPIHPRVAEALGVKWLNARTRYQVRGEAVSWETYVRRYIAHYG